MTRRGLGMIELLLVLSIIATVTLLALPGAGTTAMTRADAAARLLRSDIEYAQVHAIAHPDDPVIVVMAEDGSGYRLSLSSQPHVPIQHELSGEPWEITFGEGRASTSDGVTATVEHLDKGVLQFDALGGLTDPTLDPLYRVNCEQSEVQLTIRAGTGFVRLKR